MKRVVFSIACLSALCSAQAMSLTTPFDLGVNAVDYTSPNGDTYHRLDPSLIGIADPLVATNANLVGNYYLNKGLTAPNITIGSELTGEAQVRQQTPGSGKSGDVPPRYYMGAAYQIDYVGADQADLEWVVGYSFSSPGTTAPWLFTEGFKDTQPFYYADANDPAYHDATLNTYSLISNIYGLSAPGDYTWQILAFPTTVTHDANGVVTDIVFHDGVRLSGDVHEVLATPEPASYLALGLFALPLLRRRNRKA